MSYARRLLRFWNHRTEAKYGGEDMRCHVDKLAARDGSSLCDEGVMEIGKCMRPRRAVRILGFSDVVYWMRGDGCDDFWCVFTERDAIARHGILGHILSVYRCTGIQEVYKKWNKSTGRLRGEVCALLERRTSRLCDSATSGWVW